VGRSLAIVAFIACAFGAGGYFLQRPTIASGDVLAAELVQSNAEDIRELRCDKAIPVTSRGARFACEVVFRSGKVSRVVFDMDRTGVIKAAGEQPDQKIKRSSDPWDK
jgi:hypothetical protein